MFQKIVRIIALVLLAVLPFIGTVLMIKFSPYATEKTLTSYIFMGFLLIVVALSVLLVAVNKKLAKPFLLGGVLLFVIGAIMASVLGLGAPPPFGDALLKHPEREQYRYVLLFINALLFAGGFFLIAKNKQKEFGKWNILLMVLFVPAIAEMIWEFYHHFSASDNLKLWMDQGKKVDDFQKKYDNPSIIRLGAIGRWFQFCFLTVFIIALYRCRSIRIWSLIPLTLLSFIGIVSASVIFIYGFPLPKALEPLFVFFIPGLPFILLFWLGVSVLTKPSRNN